MATEWRNLSLEELGERLRQTRAGLLDLRLKKRLGSAGKPHVARALRKDIARLETFARQKQIAEEAGNGAGSRQKR